MTTAHRPTFDHLKGKLNHNKTHIVHKRFLLLHTQLKYRHGIVTQQDDDYEIGKIDLDKLKKSVEELKLELINREQLHYKDRNVHYTDRFLREMDKNGGDDGAMKLIQLGDNPKEKQVEEGFEERRMRILKETRDIDGSSSSSDESESKFELEESEESESESESEDENEMLLQELAKLRQKKQESIELVKRQDLTDKILEKESTTTADTNGINKSWRSETVFSNRKRTNNKKRKTNGGGDNNDDGYVNDMLRNNFHKKFMDKYVK